MNHKNRRLTHSLLSLLILTSLLLSSCGVLIPAAEPVTISFAFSQDDQALLRVAPAGLQRKISIHHGRIRTLR